MKLLLVVAGVAVLGVLAWASGFVGDEGGWAGVARIDSLLSAVLALGVIGAFVAAGGRWLSSQVVRGPMARAWGRTSPEAGKGERDAVIDQVVRGAHATTPRPGRVLASVVAIAETDGIRRWPWETPSHQRWFSTVATRLSDGLVPRLFAPDTARAVAHLAHAVARALEGVLHYRVVPAATFERKLVPPGSGSFREVASLLSGALVLVDAVHSRAGTARSMTVWHSVQSRPSGPGSAHRMPWGPADGKRAPPNAPGDGPLPLNPAPWRVTSTVASWISWAQQQSRTIAPRGSTFCC